MGLPAWLVNCWRSGSDMNGRALGYALETRCCDLCGKAILVNAMEPYQSVVIGIAAPNWPLLIASYRPLKLQFTIHQDGVESQ